MMKTRDEAGSQRIDARSLPGWTTTLDVDVDPSHLETIRLNFLRALDAEAYRAQGEYDLELAEQDWAATVEALPAEDR